MCADIINLRHVRKTRARMEKEQQADQNRLTFGRSKSEKQATQSRNAQEQARPDAHQREPASPDTGQKDH
jgi:hypothetical protein